MAVGVWPRQKALRMEMTENIGSPVSSGSTGSAGVGPVASPPNAGLGSTGSAGAGPVASPPMLPWVELCS